MTRSHARFPTYLEDQREFFDSLITEDWDSYHSAAWDRTRRAEVAEIMRVAPARRVLDIGCGCGFHDVVIAEHPDIVEVVAVDYSPRSIEVAEREYPHPNVRRAVADVFELDRGDFDLVVSFQVIEHVSWAFEFLRACARQARRGGAVAVVTPNRARLDNRWRRLRGREPELLDPQHYHEFTPSELKALASELPLERLATFGVGMTFTVPRFGWAAIPESIGRRAGARFPELANGFGQIWRVLETVA
jgi:SAM-dependent methyltransferase